MTNPIQLTIIGGTLTVVAGASPAGVFVTVRYDRFEITARGETMAYTLPCDKQVKVKVSYVDANDNPAAIDGDVKWSSSNETLAVVYADNTDSKTALIVPAGPVGQVQITAAADANLGDGTRPLLTPMDVTIVAGEAVAGTIEPVGPPAEYPHPEHHT